MWIETIDLILRPLWAQHRAMALRFAISLMASVRLFGWIRRMAIALAADYWGAIDLRTYHRLIHDWFAGRPINREVGNAIHPPATYVILWPFLGWVSVTSARWVWVVTTVSLGHIGP